MKLINIILIYFILTSLFFFDLDNKERVSGNSLSLNQLSEKTIQGVIVLDNSHDNDLMNYYYRMRIHLEDIGYIVFFTSNYSTFGDSLIEANILIISALSSNSFTQTEIEAVSNWFIDGSHNLILASKGDANSINYTTMNDLLVNLNATSRLQDDQIYHANTVFSVRTNLVPSWNVSSSSPDLTNNVEYVVFDSPSSIYANTNQVLVYAHQDQYQFNNSNPYPSTIYDNSSDGSGGERIPLVVYEEITTNSETDRIIMLGPTIWTDFDFTHLSTNFSNINFMDNVIQYLIDKTIAVSGSITINVVDTISPQAKIITPRNNSIVKGVIDLNIFARDVFGVTSIGLYIDNVLKMSNTTTYNWNTVDFYEGIHNIKLIVEDQALNNITLNYQYNVTQSYVASKNSIATVMNYNIQLSGVFAEWKDVVKLKNPDILLMTETGHFDDNSNSFLDSNLKELNDYFIDELPYHYYNLPNIANDWDGITLFSRYEIVSTQKIQTVTLDSGEGHNMALPSLYSSIDLGSKIIHIVGSHLSPGTTQTAKDIRIKEQEGIINFMDSLGDVPIIYLGDMNSQSSTEVSEHSSSQGIGAIEMLINKTDTKSSSIHTFTDVHHRLNYGSTANTFRSSPFNLSPIRIDYIFTNQHFDFILISSDTYVYDLGSDHYSIDLILDFGSWILEAVNGFDITSNITANNGKAGSISIILIISIICFTYYSRRDKKEIK